MRVGLLLVAALAALALALPATASAKNCGIIVFTPNTEDGIFGIKARGVKCSKARKVARKVRDFSLSEGPYQYSSRRFDCIGVYDDSTLPVVHWQCVRFDGANIRFDRG